MAFLYAKLVDGSYQMGKLKSLIRPVSPPPEDEVTDEFLSKHNIHRVALIAPPSAWQVRESITPELNEAGELVMERVRDMTIEEAAEKVDAEIEKRKLEADSGAAREGADIDAWNTYKTGVISIRDTQSDDVLLLKDLPTNQYWPSAPVVYSGA